MDLLDQIVLALKTTFQPPDNATSRQIRLHGLTAWLAGFFCLLLLTLASGFFEKLAPNADLALFYGAAVFVAFGLMTSGCYRALTGRPPAAPPGDYQLCWRRMVLGLAAGLLSLILPCALLLLAALILQRLGIEPNSFF